MKTALVATAILCAGLSSWADSVAFTYQAALRDEKGQIIKDGDNVKQNHLVEVRLYKGPTGGTALWGRKYSVMTDEQGLFNLAISDNTGSPLVTASLDQVLVSNQPGSLYLGLTVVGSSGEIVPRQCIYSTPYAAVASDAKAASADFKIGGRLELGSDTQGVRISKDGITMAGASALANFSRIEVTGPATVKGKLTAGSGTLQADGTGVTVSKLTAGNGALKVDGAGVAITNLTATTMTAATMTAKTLKATVTSARGEEVQEVVPVPIGGVIMWTKSTLPDTTHWAICDGTKGTPDLRGRFIVGVGQTHGKDGKAIAGDNYTSEAIGGEQSHKLTVDEMPSHKHDVRYARGKTQSDLQEIIMRPSSTTTSGDKLGVWSTSKDTEVYSHGPVVTVEAGGNGAHENRPPYYALYYIMRIK